MQEEKSTYVVGLSSNIGRRSVQQDTAIAVKNEENNNVFAILCDGMGGMKRGEKASNLCANIIYDDYCHLNNSDYYTFLIDEIEKADEQVSNICDKNENKNSSGTTVVSVIIDKANLYWASVGDSRIYIIRKNSIYQITEDHNYLMELMQRVKCRRITIEEAMCNPDKNSLVSYVGMGGVKYIDSNKKPFILMPGDCLVLCSDGLCKVLDDENIYEIVYACQDDMQNAAEYLVNEAVVAGGDKQDNTTVVTIKIIQ